MTAMHYHTLTTDLPHYSFKTLQRSSIKRWIKQLITECVGVE